MIKASVALTLTTVITTMLSSPAYAFGANGHRIVARIAENHLTAQAQSVITAITDGQSLARLATWPDEIRSDPDWKHADPWHYMSIADDASFDNYEHSDRGDVLLSLAKFEAVLRDDTATKTQHWQALAFFTHFTGDIHQPLHVGRSEDRGGNIIDVRWFDDSTNLHSVWDTHLIEHQQLSFTEYVSFIDFPTAAQIDTWQNSTYLDWAKESKAQRDQVYDFGSQRSSLPKLSYDYHFHHKDLLNRRLLQAGIRLAGKLNEIYSDD